MSDVPVCGCHGVPKRWKNDRRKPAGGSWVCTRKVAAAHARYDTSEKGSARSRRYDRSVKGGDRAARYEAQPHRKLGKQLNEMARVRVHY